MAKDKKSTQGSSTVALNKKAKHDFAFEERYEAGIVLQGWEVKAIRDGKIQLTDSYVLLKNGEAFLVGAQLSPHLADSCPGVGLFSRHRCREADAEHVSRHAGGSGGLFALPA